MSRWSRALTLAATLIASPAPPLVAQTTANPEISVIPRFLLATDDGGKLAEGKREFSRPEFSFQELEMVLSAYLNPYAKGDVVLTLPGPDVEQGKLGLEELYATILRGLPGDLNLRVGKYRTEFGRLNSMHPHAWPFITQPLVAERFIGEEGFNDLGISLSTLLPTGDLYTRLSVDLLRGESIAGGAGIADTTDASPAYAASGRLSTFFPLSDLSDCEVGGSFYTGIHDPFNHDQFWYWNLDAKFKYRPDAYTSLTLQGEVLLNVRNAQQDRELVPFTEGSVGPVIREIHSGGGYLYGNYQFAKVFSLGMRLDYAESPYGSGDRAKAVALFAGYYPVEETIGLRLQYQHTVTGTGDGAQSVNLIALQFLFSMGPHKAHPF